jgi:hypothetical protein
VSGLTQTTDAAGLRLPVPLDHPLASVQGSRTATPEDISRHPIYSGLLEERVARVLMTYPPAERAQMRARVQASVAAQLAQMIGTITTYALGDITLNPGQTLTFTGNWHEVDARNVRIAAGAQIRVIGYDPTLSATLVLLCESLGRYDPPSPPPPNLPPPDRHPVSPDRPPLTL